MMPIVGFPVLCTSAAGGFLLSASPRKRPHAGLCVGILCRGFARVLGDGPLAVAAGMNAGVDLNSGTTYIDSLRDAVRLGLVSADQVRPQPPPHAAVLYLSLTPPTHTPSARCSGGLTGRWCGAGGGCGCGWVLLLLCAGGSG